MAAAASFMLHRRFLGQGACAAHNRLHQQVRSAPHEHTSLLLHGAKELSPGWPQYFGLKFSRSLKRSCSCVCSPGHPEPGALHQQQSVPEVRRHSAEALGSRAEACGRLDRPQRSGHTGRLRRGTPQGKRGGQRHTGEDQDRHQWCAASYRRRCCTKLIMHANHGRLKCKSCYTTSHVSVHVHAGFGRIGRLVARCASFQHCMQRRE